MEELLNPYSCLYHGIEDTLYYYVVDKNTGAEAYIFSEYNTFFANKEKKVIGKCFYLHIPMMDEQICKNYKIKTISGKKFLNLGYKRTDDGFIVNPDLDIKDYASQYFPHSQLPFDNIFARNYSCFDVSTVVGVSEPRFALKQLYIKNTKIHSIIDEIINSFDVDLKDLGITGSTALSGDISSDYDIVFYGNANKLNKIKNKIDYFKKKNGIIKEYELNWPCRYYDSNSNLICCFFVCTDYSYQALKNAEIMENLYPFDVTIKDDSLSLLKAPVLGLQGNDLTSLIIFNSGFKGVFMSGDRIQGYGKKIRYYINGQEHYSVLCLSPYNEIQNYKSYFK